ncbi:MAG: bifunctional diguanylate cyclase/phosphodiesterase [Pseudomonadota bacterium]
MGKASLHTQTADPAKSLPSIEPAWLSKALELAGAFAFEMGEDGHLDFAHRETLEIFLNAPEGTLKTHQAAWNARLSEADARIRKAAIASLTMDGAQYRIDYQMTDDAGQSRPVREIGEALASADGRATFIRGVLIDQSDARHDPLTGLPNLTRLEETGSMLGDLGQRIGLPVHLLRLRLRNLDTLVETFDPELRTLLLKKAGARIKEALRSPDLASRVSETDFAAVTLNSDPDTLGLRLRAAVTGEPYETRFGPLSLEVDVARTPLKTVQSALADTLSKLSGDVRPVSQDMEWPTVEEAVAQNRLSLAFQPIVRASDQSLHHFEALLRIQAENGHVVSAFPFIVQAEDQDEIHALDRHVLDLAAEHLRQNPDLHLGINVSAGTVGDKAHSAAYVQALSDLGVMTKRLTLELTETLAVDDPDLAKAFSANVRELGCQFAVDDFASGHTSFRNLLAVEADAIKMDGSLVRGVALDENKQAFIRVMVDLAATFNVETVAEMVEDRADANMLTRLGVTYLQGYYFGRPTSEPIWIGPSQGS